MPRAALPFPVLLLAATFGVACGAQTSPAPAKVAAAEAAPAAVATPSDTPEGAVDPAGAATGSDQAAPEGAPTITADAAVHEFGAIKATDSIEHVFTIRNTGTADLKIERVQRT